MALIKCTECGAEISDKAASCPKCGNPMDQTVIRPVLETIEVTPAVKQKSGWVLKIILWIGGAVTVFVVVGLISYATSSPESRAKFDRQQASDTICDQMISDSAPGNERRDIRRMCDELKAQNK